jgi:hypothetical protein
MQQVRAPIAGGKYALNQDFCNSRHSEKLAPFPGSGGNKICPPGASSVRQLAHRSFRG